MLKFCEPTRLMHRQRCQSNIVKLPLILLTLITMVACSSVHSPAPVVLLDTSVAATNTLNEISGNKHIAQPGDTLFSIAFYSGNDYKDLAQYNNITPPYSIRVGQAISLVDTRNSVNRKENSALRPSVKKYTKVAVDPKASGEYGGDKQKKHRKKYSSKANSSNYPNNDSKWIWPASGPAKSVVVGSDGSFRGLDIKGTSGSPVIAAKGGKVVYAGNALKGYGNLVIVMHDNDYLSAYAHNDSILVKEQMYVTQGQKIATMGRSGTNDVRLHFEIREKGKSLDPLKFLPKRNKN